MRNETKMYKICITYTYSEQQYLYAQIIVSYNISQCHYQTLQQKKILLSDHTLITGSDSGGLNCLPKTLPGKTTILEYCKNLSLLHKVIAKLLPVVITTSLS